jgi:hypothetical protein
LEKILLEVRSHVSRDLLQSAEMFGNERTVVWEYVSNSLQYVDVGVAPSVQVEIVPRQRVISICDNGRGMLMNDLQAFFTMHGENQDRKGGRPGRGRFGTGKSAAFGIADELVVNSVRNGRRSIVRLTRVDLEAAVQGSPVPVEVLENEKSCVEANGTIIEIRNVRLKSIDIQACIAYIEKHLASSPRNATVQINNHVCRFREPSVVRQDQFRPTPEQRRVLGDVLLTVGVSAIPLPEESRGIAIYANGVWHSSTLAGAERREMAEFITGSLDVPALDSDKQSPAAFNASRSMSLNPLNPLVAEMFAFISAHVESVRKQIVAEKNQAKESERSRQLEREANRIAQLLNEDFASFRKSLRQATAPVAPVGGDRATGTRAVVSDDDEDPLALLMGIGDNSGTPTSLAPPDEGRSATSLRNEPVTVNPVLDPDDSGAHHGSQRRGRNVPSNRSGGIRVDFEHAGVAADRATYVGSTRTIYINLDHPQIATAADGQPADSTTFRQLAFEVAVTEYSIALAQELANRSFYIDPSDAISDIRDSIGRISRRVAGMDRNVGGRM